MSYAALIGFGAEECPPGWTWDLSTKTCRTSDASAGCPAGFDQRVPGECWPTVPTACKTLFGTFYNPAEPDRCKKVCPSGTVADMDNVCRPVSSVSPVTIVGMIVLGVVGLAVVWRK